MEKIIIQPMRMSYSKDDFKIYVSTVIDNKESTIFRNGEKTSLIGEMQSLNYNKQYIIVGEYEENKYGKQLKVAYVNEVFEETDKDLQELFLKEILTENQYKALTDKLDDPFKALKDKNIKALTSVSGVGEVVAYRLIDKYESSIDYSDAFAAFGELGVSVNMIKRIAKSYASPQLLVEKFNENPYILSDSVEGIGFKTADQIALKKGVKPKSPQRIKAFITNELKETARSLGDTYLYKNDIYSKWANFSEFSDTKITFNESIDKLIEENEIVTIKGGEVIASKRYYSSERTVALELLRLADTKILKSIKNIDEIISKVEEEQGFEFNEEQREVVRKIVNNNVIVISGGAGVGKSTVAKGIVNAVGKLNSAATALSGKAGQRLSETTGLTGQTIHRLLGYNPNEGFKMNRDNQLHFDLIVLDEASMVDIGLFRKLLEAISTGTKLCILGDTHQLQSIGAGNILLDIMNSDVILSEELIKIHRQAQKSGIITVASKVRKGERVIKSSFEGEEIIGELQDFKFIIQSNAKTSEDRITKDVILKEFTRHLDNGESVSDIQVIVPMKSRGKASTQRLNKEMQEIYNPHMDDESELVTKRFKDEYILRVGDKVICKKNNYKTSGVNGDLRPIFNGSMGVIKSVDKESESLIVEFYNIGSVVIGKSIKGSIELAYAITIHSAQGSQWKNVIVGIDYSMYTMLNKELLYTAITRAEKYCTLVGENKAIGHAVRTSNLYTRQTLLKKFLRKFAKESK